MSTTIPTLPPLPQIPGLNPSAASNIDLQQVASDLAPVSQLAGATSSASSSTASSSSTSSTGHSFFGLVLEDAIFIIVGILLIAAGLFAFKGTQTVIQTVGKAASKAGEVAA